MADLTSTRTEAAAALANLGTALAAARTELAAATEKVAGLSLEHGIVSAMIEAGKIVTAVETAAPKVEAAVESVIAKVEKDPAAKWYAAGVALLIVLAVGGYFFLRH